MVLSYERKLRRHKEYEKQICDGKGRIMEKHIHFLGRSDLYCLQPVLR